MAISYSEAQRHMEKLGKSVQWRERIAHYEGLGSTGAQAWRLAYQDVCAGDEGAPKPAVAEPTAADFEGKECSLEAAIQWVMRNAFSTATTFKDAPSQEAWQLLQYARLNPTDFFNKHVLATMPKQSDLAAAAARDEDGAGIIEALEAVKQSLREAREEAEKKKTEREYLTITLYDEVLELPRDVGECCHYRSLIIQWSCGPDKKRRQDGLWHLCKSDVLFWINTFVFTYDPRRKVKLLPMVTWEYQDEAIRDIELAIDEPGDLLIEKSRDMGATWLVLLVFLHRWLFSNVVSFMLVSRIEDLVDKRNDPDSLFWKLDFALKWMPGWMRPIRDRSALSMVNLENGSTIMGSATTANAGVGGRRTAIMLDEFAAVPDGYSMLAATRDNSDCRIFNSTPRGIGNAFYDLAHGGTIPKLRLHWTRHPHKAEGMYRDAKGKARSPWYDKQCKRAANSIEIAQELDIDYVGSEYRFFPAELVEELLRETVMEPVCVGDIDFDAASLEPLGFDIRTKGPWTLWRHPHAITNNEALVCVIGSDVGTGGAKSSNSTLIVADALTGENIAEFASCTLRPEEFARVAIVASRFFGNALLIPERNGPGRIMVDAMLALGFRNIWFERAETTIGTPEGVKPGWFSTPDTKHGLLGDWRRALADRAYVCRSALALKESLLYTYNPAGRVWSVLAMNEQDPSGAGDNHGDRVIGHALAWKGCTTMRDTARETERQVNPVVQDTNTFAWRRQAREHAAGRQGW